MTSRSELATVAPALVSWRALLIAPIDESTWRAIAQTTLGWPWLTAVGVSATILVSTSFALIPSFGLGVLTLSASLWLAKHFARAEAARLTAQTGIVVTPAPARTAPPGFWKALVSPITDPRAWTAVGYAIIGIVTSSVGFVIVIATESAALAGMLSPFYAWSAYSYRTVGWVGAGLLLMWIGAVSAQGMSALQLILGQALLGPLGAQDIAKARAAQEIAEARAAHLATTRTEAVTAGDDERRRIERDLHDGAQQRLVALGLELGAARRLAAHDPASAIQALDHAHIEVKEVLAELRDLVRGIHPAVLTDRGFDAALSALAARTPVPVEVRVKNSQDVAMCGASAQAAAYFVVAEALTNITRHAAASSARIEATVTDGLLHIMISDDGRGGADLRAGSGLEGLRARVAALDGSFEVHSSLGNGTTVEVRLPCAS